MKLYLHIGMQKAGSKAIQGFLTTNPDRLSRHGIDGAYDLKGGIWHQALFMAYDDAQDARMAALAQRAEAAVLSYEKAYCAESETISRLAAHASAIQILFVIRPPAPWLNSMKNQIAKAHRPRISDWEALSVKDGVLNEALRVAEHLNRWEQIVGRDAITVTQFTPRADIVAPFLHWLGLPADAHPGPPGTNPNPGLDARSIRIMLEVKRQLAEAPQDTHIRAVTLCHQELRDSWIDSRHSPPVRLVSEAEETYCKETLAPQYRAVLTRYRCLGSSVPEGLGAGDPTTRMSDFTPSTAERAIATTITHQARHETGQASNP